jgi:hypothetical protein
MSADRVEEFATGRVSDVAVPDVAAHHRVGPARERVRDREWEHGCP